mgnify:CR=1 FL=1
MSAKATRLSCAICCGNLVLEAPPESTGRSDAGRCKLFSLASGLRGHAPLVCVFSCACRLQAEGCGASIFLRDYGVDSFRPPA